MVLLLSHYVEGLYTGREQGVRGYSVVPEVFFSQSTVFSKKGYG